MKRIAVWWVCCALQPVQPVNVNPTLWSLVCKYSIYQKNKRCSSWIAWRTFFAAIGHVSSLVDCMSSLNTKQDSYTRHYFKSFLFKQQMGVGLHTVLIQSGLGNNAWNQMSTLPVSAEVSSLLHLKLLASTVQVCVKCAVGTAMPFSLCQPCPEMWQSCM